jgi:hypothetical protein
MIVNVMRRDLRDESSMAPKAMAHEAFALSPISARATQPSEEDYEAISAAFMETSRGRWFLSEFAKRNRNADTRLVLDAVARIEQTLVTQNQPDPDTGRAEALAAIKAALDEARAAASVALDGLALDDHLAPVRKGTRIIREISWRWREIGADGRICDLIDSQLGAIDASCDRVATVDPRSALTAAFDLIDESIAAFDVSEEAATEVDGDAVSSPSSNPWAPPSGPMPTASTAHRTPAATGEAETALAVQVPVEPTVVTVEAAVETIADVANNEKATAEAINTTAAAGDTAANTEADMASDVAAMTVEAADAHDDAVLDLIAAEMAAPDASDDDDEMPEANLVDAPPAAPEAVAASSEAPAAPAIVPDIQPPLPSSPEPSREPSLAPAMEDISAPSPGIAPEISAQATKEASSEISSEVSLGSTLIASGIVRKPLVSASDALAAIRRLSQAEKIALFS